jgi:hypothetical protein
MPGFRYSRLSIMELPVFYIRCLFISMPLIREIYIPENSLPTAMGPEFSIQCYYSKTPPLWPVPCPVNNFVG